MAAVLQERIDVGADLCERAGDGGHDAGLVVHDEAKVVRGEEFAGDCAAAHGKLHSVAALRDGEDV